MNTSPIIDPVVAETILEDMRMMVIHDDPDPFTNLDLRAYLVKAADYNDMILTNEELDELVELYGPIGDLNGVVKVEVQFTHTQWLRVRREAELLEVDPHVYINRAADRR